MGGIDLGLYPCPRLCPLGLLTNYGLLWRLCLHCGAFQDNLPHSHPARLPIYHFMCKCIHYKEANVTVSMEASSEPVEALVTIKWSSRSYTLTEKRVRCNALDSNKPLNSSRTVIISEGNTSTMA